MTPERLEQIHQRMKDECLTFWKAVSSLNKEDKEDKTLDKTP